MKDVGSLLLVLKLEDDFDGGINDIVWADRSQIFAMWLRIEWRILSRNKSSFIWAVNNQNIHFACKATTALS